ncbi:MAG: flagellar filament capping protein FliD [Sandaracinaceae bacterium]
MSSGISFSGLATGIDSASIISQLMQLERQPIARLEDKQRIYSSQASKLRSFETKMKALQDAAEKLGEGEGIRPMQVSSADESVVKASITSGASVGPTEINVTALAASEKTFSDGVADASATLLGSGLSSTLSITVGTDDAVDIAIDDTDTLESLVGKINDSGADVTAGIVFDGTDYRLRVAGNDTGLDRGITFAESTSVLGLDNPANELQAASDAVFTVDGLPMTRSSNSFSDAVPGLSMTLNGVSDGATTTQVNVERDDSAQQESVQAFVDAYNSVMTSLNAEFTYTGSPRGPESLSGDFTLRSVQSRLRSFVGTSVAGTSGAFQTLASIGIETKQDGTLELDAGELTDAMNSDAEAVTALFAGNGSGVEGFVSGFDDLIEALAGSDGALNSRIDSLEGRSSDLDDQIDRLELRLDDTETRLRNQFSVLEQTVSGMQSQGNQILAALTSLGG